MNQRAQLPFFLTPEHPCSYYAGRMARTVFGDPKANPDVHMQTALAQHGFRRSGRYLYKPQCPGCNDCVPARVDVANFRPSRSQRRNLKRNADLDVSISRPWCNDALLALYNHYQHWRHPEGQMIAAGSAHFAEFLLSGWSDSYFLEIRSCRRLVAVSVVDRLEDGHSAVYTFYDPAEEKRGLGSFALLKLIETARFENLPWVYLGYWLPGHQKMDYKRRFRPLELLGEHGWQRTEDTSS